MPELPEVETVRRGLVPHLVGRTITGVTVRNRALRVPVPVRRLRARARGRRIVDISRRAKYLQILLEGDACILVHLGMSGRLQIRPRGEAIAAHVHVIFDLDDGDQLRFVDPRRFGLVDLLAVRDLATDPRLRDLGPEPLSDACTPRAFHERARGLRRPIKNFLMDSRRLVGVGNIYASEALFVAGIHPARPAGRMSRASWERLVGAIKEVLRDAIAQGGTTLNDFRHVTGDEGSFQVSLRVYGREGEPCIRCGRPVLRRVLAGRSTFYCGRCQR